MPVSDYSDLDLPTDAKLAAGSYSEMAKIANTIRKNSMRKTIREISTDGSADWKDILPAFYGSGSILEAVEGIIVSMASAGKCGEAVRVDFDGNHAGTERESWHNLNSLCSTLPGFKWVFVRPFENAPDVPSSANGVWDQGAVRFSLNAKNMSVGFVSFNPEVPPMFLDWSKENLSADVKKGTVFMLMKTPTGMSFEELGEAGEKLERGNYSEEVLEDYDRLVKELKTDKPRGRLHVLQGSPGGGKCLGKDTPVMKFDGSVVPVQDIKPGDFLMGPDSKPRLVMTTNTGTGNLFNIIPTKGDPWVCNDVHILTLRNSRTDEIIDIPLDKYQAKTNAFKSKYKAFRAQVDFPSREVSIDPYFMGVWFGDGTKRQGKNGIYRVSVSKPDQEIADACQSVADTFGVRISTSDQDKKCPTYHFASDEWVGQWRSNPVTNKMREILGPNLTIPKEYIYNSREVRLQFLAGFLDTDGFMEHNGFEICQKRKDYAEAIQFVARSLGLACYTSVKVVNGEEYQRMYISGDTDMIPTRIPRKQAGPRRQVKNVQNTGFSVEPAGFGDYYGFTLDGDGRFLLGDFTVTHNTYQIKGLLDECAESATMVLIPANLVPEVAGPDGVGIIVDFRRDYPNRPLVFLLEDADEVLAPRNGHNISGVSSLLNMGDGIVGATLDIRIVATTNATDAELDDAIKRPGRLNVLCTINKLNPERASAVYKRLTGTDMSFDTDMSLAEVYQKAYDAGWKGTGTKKGKKIGFA